jgi:predicted nucleic-acid-binding Zn-ribbon protein
MASYLDEQIKAKFKCAKCRNTTANVRRFAATGAGITRFIDWQHNEYISVSCMNCGYTEMFDPEVFSDKGKAVKILDLIFGLGD